MTLALTGPLNQLDIYRIVHDFDRTRFDTAKSPPKDWLDRVIVIIQFERKLFYSHLPIELIDNIMRRCLEGSPSVRGLLLFYKNTPAMMLHPLPLSNDIRYINNASQSLLVRLKQASAEGELDSYLQLMTWVFAQHFRKLMLDQKLDLIRRSSITPWEQKPTSQKLELLGRIQALTLWGKVKVNLQLLLWKVKSAAVVQSAAIWALENKIIGMAVYFSGCVGITGSLILFQTSNKVRLCFFSAFFAWATSLAMAGLGFALQIPILPKSVKETGAWIQSFSWSCFLIPTFLEGCLPKAHGKLHDLLSQSINIVNITLEQNSFANAHFPDLINQWLNLTMPNDTNTGSLQRQQ